MDWTFAFSHFLVFWISSFVFFSYTSYTLGTLQISKNYFRPFPKSVALLPFFKTVLLNQFFITIPFLLIYENVYEFPSPIVTYYGSILPANSSVMVITIYAWQIIFQPILKMLLVEEVLFYVIHRFILHYEPVYQAIHSVHHEFVTPNPFSSIYAHPVEHLIQNILPLWVACYLINPTYFVTLLWICMATVSACWSHTLSDRDKFHVIHHITKNCNFGTQMFLDWIFGTYRQHALL